MYSSIANSMQPVKLLSIEDRGCSDTQVNIHSGVLCGSTFRLSILCIETLMELRVSMIPFNLLTIEATCMLDLRHY